MPSKHPLDIHWTSVLHSCLKRICAFAANLGSHLLQDIPDGGLHGIFPVMHSGNIYIAGGADVTSFSQSNVVYKFTPEVDEPVAFAPSPLAIEACEASAEGDCKSERSGSSDESASVKTHALWWHVFCGLLLSIFMSQ